VHEPREWDDLPLDPDVDVEEDLRHHRDHEPRLRDTRLRTRWPHIHWTAVLVVAAGGFVGGVARDAVGRLWETPSSGFPWPILLVNTVGAFVLGLLLVMVIEVLHRPHPLLRPLVGTGFCGALTTFSSVVVAVDRLTAAGRLGVAAAYVLAGVALGLAAALGGVRLGRALAPAYEPFLPQASEDAS
jgi:CrcB protein